MDHLTRVHSFTMIAKHMFCIGGAYDDLDKLCARSEEAGDDPQDHMSIRVGGSYYRAESVLKALDDLRVKAMLDSLTPSDSLLMVILQDSRVVDAYGVLLQQDK